MLAPVGTDLFGVQAKHGATEVGILGADVEDGLAGGGIDGGQEDVRTACLAGTLHDGITVRCKFFAIEVAVGVDVVHIWGLTAELSGTIYLSRWRSSSM